jgi:hypothetical protein
VDGLRNLQSWFFDLILPSLWWGGGDLNLKTENKALFVTDMRVSIQSKGINEWENMDYVSITKCHLIFFNLWIKVS